MKRLNTVLTVILLVLIFGAIAVSATGSTYTTEDDPLVALSYVEQSEERIVQRLLTAIDDGTLTDCTSALTFTAVHLDNGQSINATGVCEFILRSGEAVAYVNDEANIASGVGLNDMTGGAEITNALAVPKYHHVMIPRGDGRGITVTSADAYFMVRGSYEIIK